MKRLTIAAIVIGAVFLAALVVLSFFGYRSLRSMRAEIHVLSARVDSATQLAQSESSAALAASQRADEAAAEAQAAASGRQKAQAAMQAANVGRQQAEAAKQAAEASQAEALAKAEQATENALQARQAMERMRLQRKKELDQMQQALNRVVPTRRTPNGMVIELRDATFRFAFDSAELNVRDRELLSRIAGILLVSKGYGLSIYGYTDDIGTAAYNQKLSVRRANAVRDYLAQAGLDPAIMQVKGYGKSDPLVPGDSAAARAQNRRVEIALADTSIQYVGEAKPGQTK